MRMTSSDGIDERLPTGRAIRMTAALYAADEMAGRSGLRQKLDLFHDDKGKLQVTWAACPTFAEVMAVGRAWCQVANEYETQHNLADGRPLCDHDGDTWTFDPDAAGLMFEAECGDVAVCVGEYPVTGSAG